MPTKFIYVYVSKNINPIASGFEYLFIVRAKCISVISRIQILLYGRKKENKTPPKRRINRKNIKGKRNDVNKKKKRKKNRYHKTNP